MRRPRCPATHSLNVSHLPRMQLATERYIKQAEQWPSQGKHILAHYDAETIVVYQAYRPSIGTYAIEQVGTQGHEFTFAEAAARYEQAFGEKLSA